MEDNKQKDLLMTVWDELEHTDIKFTKKSTVGAKLTSINGVYQFKKMTEVFGPCGVGWGYETTESRIDPTGPIYMKMYSPETNSKTIHLDSNGNPVILGEGRLHTLKIKLWFTPEVTLAANHSPGKTAEIKNKYFIEGIGHTKFIYAGGDGVIVDEDFEKKSLTDAITNAMSKLGMSADVRMGMFDDADYVAQAQLDSAIEHSDNVEATMAEQRHEFEDWLKAHMQAISEQTENRTLEILFKGGTPRMTRQATRKQIADREELKNKVARENLARDKAAAEKKEEK